MPSGEAAGTTKACPGLSPADMGKEAAIGLFLGFALETTRFELGVEMHRTAIGAGAEFKACRQDRQCFQNFHQRLRRFQAARVHLDESRRFVPGTIRVTANGWLA